MKAKAKKKTVPREGNSMKDSELSQLTVRELKELRARIDETIVVRTAEELKALRSQLQKMAEEAGYDLEDFLKPGRGSRGGKVAIKYVNPENPEETWTGRGRPPRWLAAKLKAGAKLDDFKV